MIVALAAAIVATSWGALPLLLWAAAVATIAGAGSWWASTAWNGVDVQATVEPARLFIGESAFLIVRIANRRTRALPIVRVVCRLPDELFAEASPEPTAFRGHRRRLTLAAGAQVELRLPLHPAGRG